MTERNGKRKIRSQMSQKRIPNLGHYLIITDTKETERNFLYGLRDSIPKDIKNSINIKVLKVKSSQLLKEAERLRSLDPQYGDVWIVFDRDRVENFNNIIASANLKGINVGWSNPCIEIFFHAYLGAMPYCDDSVKCVDNFDYKSINVMAK